MLIPVDAEFHDASNGDKRVAIGWVAAEVERIKVLYGQLLKKVTQIEVPDCRPDFDSLLIS